MPANAMNTGSAPKPDPASLVHPSLNTVMISHTFLTLLIPLLLALFYFSTPQSRRKVVFSLNVVCIFIAFVNGVLTDAYAIHTILEPTKAWSQRFDVAFMCIGVCQSLVADLALFLRLIIAYPPNHLGSIGFGLLITPPILFKLARIVNLILFLSAMVDALNGPNAARVVGILYATKPYIKIEWGAQMMDNAYASLAFLWKMRHHRSHHVTSGSSRVTLAQRMNTLFRIALSNFVVPTIFSIIQFVGEYRHVNPIVLNNIVLVNTMLATFGVVFATVWTGAVSQQEEEHALTWKYGNTTSRLKAAFGRGAGRRVDQLSTVTVTGSGYSSHDEFKA